MKTLGLYATVERLGNLPGSSCVSVYYHAPSLAFYIVGCDEPESVYTESLPETAKLVSAGQPEKFFNYLLSLLCKDFYKPEDNI